MRKGNDVFFIGVLFLIFCLILMYCGLKKTNQIIQEEIRTDVLVKEDDVVEIDEVMAISLDEEIVSYSKSFEPAFLLDDYERWVACCMIAGEAAGESYDGQWAVAQCIYQACVNDNLQPSEVKIQYQYSGWNEMLEFDNPELWAQIEEIVSRVFDYGEMCVDDEILWFYAPKWMKDGVSEWHESQRFVIEIGGHKFFGKWD